MARAWAIGILSIAAAVASGMQAVSNVYASRMPQLSVALSPYAAKGYETLAVASVLARDRQGRGGRFDPTVTLANARASVDRSPLSPNAIAILGLAETDVQKQGRIFLAASRLSRRSQFLQGILLQYHSRRANLTETLSTLDALFKVHPESVRVAMPMLTAQLANEKAVPVFHSLLKDNPSWTDDFIRSAANGKDVAHNLVRLRLLLGASSAIKPETDRLVLGRLVKEGSFSEAYSIYRLLRGAGLSAEPKENIDWRHEFPPFDWRLVDTSDYFLRSNPSLTSAQVFIRSGRGGVLAERLVEKPLGAVALHIEHSIQPIDQVGDLRLSISCASDIRNGIEVALSPSPMQWKLDGLPPDCPFYRLVILGRAWSNKADIEGEIGKIAWIRH